MTTRLHRTVPNDWYTSQVSLSQEALASKGIVALHTDEYSISLSPLRKRTKHQAALKDFAKSLKNSKIPSNSFLARVRSQSRTTHLAWSMNATPLSFFLKSRSSRSKLIPTVSHFVDQVLHLSRGEASFACKILFLISFATSDFLPICGATF